MKTKTQIKAGSRTTVEANSSGKNIGWDIGDIGPLPAFPDPD